MPFSMKVQDNQTRLTWIWIMALWWNVWHKFIKRKKFNEMSIQDRLGDSPSQVLHQHYGQTKSEMSQMTNIKDI